MPAASPVAHRPSSLLALLGLWLPTACFNPGPGTIDQTDGTTAEPATTTETPTTGNLSATTEPGTTTDEPAVDSTGDPSTGATAVCGDGLVEGAEECDDGDANADSSECKSDCTLQQCGDGYLWAGMEECDDGNTEDSDACLSTCVLATCGDGFVLVGTEECDDMGESGTCDADCTLAACGDGVINATANELCDDGNADDSDDCPGSCQPASCGDGYVHAATEECDTNSFGSPTCMDYGLGGTPTCDAQCQAHISGCDGFPCNDGGAYVNGFCWYLSAGCESAQDTCAAHGLTGNGGFTNSVWDMPTMEDLADQLGYTAGGVNGCCVEFAWVENDTIYTHNFGPQFYNWGGCYSEMPTIKLCNPF